MLMLAGVAFRDAGVLVRLLLLGVMPLGAKRSCFTASATAASEVTYATSYILYLAQAHGNGP